MNETLKDLARALLFRSGLLYPARAIFKRRRAAVLRYHSISAETFEAARYRSPSIAVSPTIFREQIALLSRHYTIVPLERILFCMRDGAEFPENSVALTFDDGYRDNFLEGLPILLEHNATATFYISSSAIGDGASFWVSRLRRAILTTGRDRLSLPSPEGLDLPLGGSQARERAIRVLESRLKMSSPAAIERVLGAIERALPDHRGGEESGSLMLSWDEVRAMARAGMTIGSHTSTHPNLPSLGHDDLLAEIRGSKIAIEQRIGVPVHHFSYPNGGAEIHFDDRIKAAVREAGYASAATSVEGTVTVRDDPFELRRIGVGGRFAKIPSFTVKLEREKLRHGPPILAARSRGLDPAVGEERK